MNVPSSANSLQGPETKLPSLHLLSSPPRSRHLRKPFLTLRAKHGDRALEKSLRAEGRRRARASGQIL